jgi:transcriptional regulator of acetoin/glycerol metabolism
MKTLEEVIQEHTVTVLDAVGWNVAKAARRLDIERSTLLRRMAKWGLEAPTKSEAEAR